MLIITYKNLSAALVKIKILREDSLKSQKGQETSTLFR
jgi:hypothetical protein